MFPLGYEKLLNRWVAKQATGKQLTWHQFLEVMIYELLHCKEKHINLDGEYSKKEI